ncbi:monosaccharide ABC transporter membrane protein, CUT2 family [Thalassovita litoralis]|jgi:ribose transport system permease protein|uniref:Monosaccharide ABC transporter membrane protein, CUT2 family n=1 Tax=Thalassovita litoralis TaxID=1010611 RepID=A0A521BMI8_9RHOB|nr:SMP-30/gluconolactonase/LRE family protein [Thalassovita litoralis]SMO48319.1 monosaccharide ABC transporter membrane protein, CUT2 family [Thalassovita litoralis]
MSQTLKKLRYKYWPDHIFGEILQKPWMETAVPLIVLIFTIVFFSAQIDNFISANNLSDNFRQAAELGFVVLGISLVLIVGGIDLSVASIFALCNLLVLYCMHVWQMPLIGAVSVTLLLGAALGAINGILIGYFRMRAFLTTMVTLIVFKAIHDLLNVKVAVAISSNFPDSPAWDRMGYGAILSIPTVVWAFGILAIFTHIFLTRLRYGWWLLAVGGNRRSAYNTGLPVNRIVALSYVASGVLTAASAIFYAARLASPGADTGKGLEITVLTAAILGGIRLGGGKGSVMKAILGTLIILLITNGLLRMATPAGTSRIILATILLLAATLDIRWFKNRHKAVQELYVSPALLELPGLSKDATSPDSDYAPNERLHDVEIIGLGQVEAPEDVVLDEDDNLYCGSRHGDIIRFFAPDYKRHEVYARIGGQPLGMTFDAEYNLYVCVGGMGLYRVTRDRKVELVTDETNRHFLSIIDDSRLRLADDLDILPDGRILFSEATVRYEMHEWPTDALEGRGNGRIIMYDPKQNKTTTVLRNLIFPNGIVVASDKQSILFAESWNCTIKRYWFEGPKKGKVEMVIPNLPGYPDNINRASDGNYWLAIMGMRSQVFDLSMRKPGFRRRMSKQLPGDEWLAPNINIGCIVKFNEAGEILDVLWDRQGINHPMITSMREHKGYLYIGGITNNRIGRLKLDDADETYVSSGKYHVG